MKSSAPHYLLDLFAHSTPEHIRAYAKDFNLSLKLSHTAPRGIVIFGSSYFLETSRHYKKARLLGRLLAENGHTVITNGDLGIMEAVSQGAYEYGGRSIGFTVASKNPSYPNSYLTDIFKLKYFPIQKSLLLSSAQVFVFFPGDADTLADLSLVLSLMHRGELPKTPIFLFDKTFWKPFSKFLSTKISSTEITSPKSSKLYKITDNLDDIIAAANKIPA